VIQLVRERGLDDVIVIVGGIIPDEDIPKLKEAGIAAVFLPGTLMEEIVTFIRQNVKRKEEI